MFSFKKNITKNICHKQYKIEKNFIKLIVTFLKMFENPKYRCA